MFKKLVVFTLMLPSALQATEAVNRWIPRLALENINEGWGIGVGGRIESPILKETTAFGDTVPLMSYHNPKFYLFGSSLGFHAINESDFKLDLIGQYRFDGYKNDDSIYLNGLKGRKNTFDAGISLNYLQNWGELRFDALADTLGRHKGYELTASYSKQFKTGDLTFEPYLQGTYQSKNLVDYYFGVHADETKINRPLYEAKAAFNPQLGLNVRYQLTQNSLLLANFAATSLSSEIKNSPLIKEKNQFSGFLGYHYNFGGYKQNSSNLGLKENTGKWYFRMIGGLGTDTKLNEIIRGKLNTHPDKMAIAGFDVGKAIVEDFQGLPIDFVWKLGYLRHFEKKGREDFNQYNLALKAYYKFDLPVKTRVGIAQGLSYADKIPYLEVSDAKDKPDEVSHWLLHLDVSIDANLGDIFNSKTVDNCFLGFAVSHRSGVFGSVELFNRVYGGSNYNSLYLECVR
jgi:outer membrane protein